MKEYSITLLTALLLINMQSFVFVMNTPAEDVPMAAGVNDETAYLQLRTKTANIALQKFLGVPLEKTVALCGSGGGYRALAAMLGFMLGTETIGLLDCSTYVAALSGSTWTLGTYFAYQKSLSELADIIKARVQHPFKENCFQSLKQLAGKLKERYRKTRNLQIVDLWGGLIVDRLLGDLDQAQEIGFSDLFPRATESVFADICQRYPLPLFTAVHPEPLPCCGCCHKNSYHWFEINPYNTHLCLSSEGISTRKLGLFAEDERDASASFLPLSFILGVCGSAFCINFRDMIDNLRTSLVAELEEDLRSSQGRDIYLKELIESLLAGRISPAKIPNFTSSPSSFLTLVDAGLCFNLPVTPLLERHADIIIICDASNNAYDGTYPELIKAAHYAMIHHLPFPSIRHPNFKDESLIIFGQDEPDVPLIFYFYNSYPIKTTIFTYTAGQFDSLCLGMKDAVTEHAEIIKEAIKNKYKAR